MKLKNYKIGFLTMSLFAASTAFAQTAGTLTLKWLGELGQRILQS